MPLHMLSSSSPSLPISSSSTLSPSPLVLSPLSLALLSPSFLVLSCCSCPTGHLIPCWSVVGAHCPPYCFGAIMVFHVSLPIHGWWWWWWWESSCCLCSCFPLNGCGVGGCISPLALFFAGQQVFLIGHGWAVISLEEC